MLHFLTTWRHRKNLEPNFSPVMCIREVHLSDSGLFNFATDSVKLAFSPAWLSLPKSQGSCDPSWHVTEPHLQGWGALCPPGHSWDLLCNSSVTSWVHFCRKGEATTAQQGTKQDWSTKLLLLLGENGVLLAFVQGTTGKAFLGKVFMPHAGNSALWTAAASRLTPLGCASKGDKKRALCFQQEK